MDNLKEEMIYLHEKASILKALSNPVRLCIVKELLQRGECNVSSMQNCLEMSQSTVSQHISRLRDMGIIRGERRGLEVFYKVIDPDAISVIDALFKSDK